MSYAADIAALDAWWSDRQAEVIPTLDQNGVTALWWSYGLAGDGAVQDEAELDQTLKIICTTPHGADVHRPTFSSGIWGIVDWPIPRATPSAIRETSQAIQRWEPRVTLVGVKVVPYPDGDIQSLRVSVNWTVGSFQSRTTFTV